TNWKDPFICLHCSSEGITLQMFQEFRLLSEQEDEKFESHILFNESKPKAGLLHPNALTEGQLKDEEFLKYCGGALKSFVEDFFKECGMSPDPDAKLGAVVTGKLR